MKKYIKQALNKAIDEQTPNIWNKIKDYAPQNNNEPLTAATHPFKHSGRMLLTAACSLIVISISAFIVYYFNGFLPLGQKNHDMVAINTPVSSPQIHRTPQVNSGLSNTALHSPNISDSNGKTGEELASKRNSEIKYVSTKEQAENILGIRLYEPSLLPGSTSLNKIAVYYKDTDSISTPYCAVFEYSSPKHDVAYNIYQNTLGEDEIEELINRFQTQKDFEGNPSYEKVTINNTAVYISRAGESRDKYSGVCIYNNTRIQLTYFDMKLSRDDVINIFKSILDK